MSFGTSDNYVNTLIIAEFNLFSRAIQGDTHRFESKKRFIEVRKKTFTCFLTPIYAETFEFYSLVFTLVLICEQRPQSTMTFRNTGMLRIFEKFSSFRQRT